jgi:hypothetical protein
MLAPTPSARMTTASNVKPGDFANVRNAWPKSFSKSISQQMRR